MEDLSVFISISKIACITQQKMITLTTQGYIPAKHFQNMPHPLMRHGHLSMAGGSPPSEYM